METWGVAQRITEAMKTPHAPETEHAPDHCVHMLWDALALGGSRSPAAYFFGKLGAAYVDVA